MHQLTSLEQWPPLKSGMLSQLRGGLRSIVACLIHEMIGPCRFDLIYLVLDKAEEATDRKLARHLLSLHYERHHSAAQVRCTPSEIHLPCSSHSSLSCWALCKADSFPELTSCMPGLLL